MEANHSAFKFNSYSILKSTISIEDKNDSINGKLKIKITPSGSFDDTLFVLQMDINIVNESESLKIFVLTEAVFEFNKTIEEKDLSSYFCINAPAIVFPYIRAYISTLTALSGIDTLILPTLNLSNLKDQLKNNIKR